MNNYEHDMADTPDRSRAERHLEGVRLQGGMFVEAVRVTRMPMIVTDATLEGNPIIFANEAFTGLSGYSVEELLGQHPHFMNGDGTDAEAIASYQQSMRDGEDATLELVQYRKDGTPFRAMLFATALGDGQGSISNHFLSYLDISRRYDAEEGLRLMTEQLESRVSDRTRELEAANKALAQLVDEREMLVAEVNHRAKNSLSIAASLISLQAHRQVDGNVKALFYETQERLTAMARVHDLLSRSETMQRIDVSIYMRDLCEAHRPIAESGGRIEIETDLESGIMVNPDTAVPLGIVLTELITNALKYAFPEPRSGRLLAELRRTDGDQIEVVICDDGIGMAEAREGSLGYGIIRSLVRQIGGTLDVRSVNGLTVTIRFPQQRRATLSTPAGAAS
jgi:PAS domain S-box-containing protein